MGLLYNMSGQIRQRGAPITVMIIALAAFIFLADWLLFRGNLSLRLVFFPEQAYEGAQVYRFLTYPFAYNNFLAILFLGLWLWSIGSTIESDLGSMRYLGFWIIVTLLGSIFYSLGCLITNTISPLFGLWFSTAAVTIAWGTRYPNVPLTFMLVLPITGKWLAWISVLLVIFGMGEPIVAFFAAIPFLLVYLFAADKISFLRWGRGGGWLKISSRKESANFNRYLGEVEKRKAERDEKERLRKLFEGDSFQDGEESR